MGDTFARRLTRRRLIERALNGVALATLAGWGSACQRIGWVQPPALPVGTPGGDSVGRATATIGSVRATATIQAGPLERQFFVDATAGSDGNDGLSTAAPLKTIAKVNTLALRPGDQVLFKRGETWAEQLTVPGSGAAGQPIIFGAFGSGPKPIIDGGNVREGIFADGKGFLVIDNLDVRNAKDACYQFQTGAHDILVQNCNGQHAGNDVLIFIGDCYNGTVRNCTFSDAYQGIVGAQSTCIEFADGGHDFLVENCTLTTAHDAGLTVHNHATTDPQGRTDLPTNVTVRDCTITNCPSDGLNVQTHDTTAGATIVFDNITVSGCGTGLRVDKLSTTSAYFHGSLTVSDCVFHDNTSYGFYLSGDNITLLRPLSYGATQQNTLVGCITAALYHPTIYQNAASAIWPLLIQNSRTNGVTVRNAIIYQASSSGQVIGTLTGAITGVTIDYTHYNFPNTTGARWMWNNTAYTYANWLLNSGQDAHSSPSNTTDPKFVTLGSDFHLQATSPAIDAGVVIAGVNDGTGGSTHYLGAAPDLGFAEKA